jgi:ribosomal protein S18 acetylase RimI-like enzyme
VSRPADIEIRPAEPKDHPAVLDLSPRLTIGVAPWRDPSKVARAVRGWIESSLTDADAPGHAVFVAVLGVQVVGFVTVAERAHFTGDLDGYVGELVTAGGMEGRGIGRALMAAAERWADARGLAHLTLETGAANDRAREFYRLAGYQDEDVRLTKRIAP